MRTLLLLLTLGLGSTLQAAGHGDARPGDLLQVPLLALHPTQAVLGHDQVHYKLGRAERDPSLLFDEYCELSGAGSLHTLPAGADLHDSSSFSCSAATGSQPQAMKTVVVGPLGQLFLTDGHHSFTLLQEHPAGGAQLKVWVRVSDNFSDSADLPQFWQRMQAAGKVWLRDGRGQPLSPQQLPRQLGLQQLQDDPYRSLVYFTRDIGYAKPSQGLPNIEFLEFYWGDWLRSQLPLSRYDLNRRNDYRSAVEAAARLMVALEPQQPVGDSGFSARQLGGYSRIDRKQLDKVSDRKLSHATRYRQRLASGQPGA